MGRFIIFIGVIFIFSLLGLLVYWLWNKIYLAIKRKEKTFDVEAETYEKIKDEIRKVK